MKDYQKLYFVYCESLWFKGENSPDMEDYAENSPEYYPKAASGWLFSTYADAEKFAKTYINRSGKDKKMAIVEYSHLNTLHITKDGEVQII